MLMLKLCISVLHSDTLSNLSTGIGFKSVFLITSQPYIFSNGYQIKFNEKDPTSIGTQLVIIFLNLQGQLLKRQKLE